MPTMETLLNRYIERLKQYNEHTNIYSKSAYDKLPFHIQDSIYLSELITNKKQVVFDFGSGSGLPAIPIAIMNPLNEVYAIESKSRKTMFLESVKQDLKLTNLTVITKNLYEWKPPSKADIITAKAFASLEKIQTIAVKCKQTAAQIYIPISHHQATQLSNNLAVTIIKVKQHYFLTQKPKK